MNNDEIKAKANDLRKEYMKQWRMKNKDKTRKHQQDFWERKALEQVQASAQN